MFLRGKKSLVAIVHSLVLMAWIFSALIPAGYMPSFQGTDKNTPSFEIVICTAYGLKTISSSDLDSESDHEQAKGQHCDFVKTASIRTPVLLFDQVFVDYAFDYAQITHSQFRAHLVKNWSAQAPPSSVV